MIYIDLLLHIHHLIVTYQLGINTIIMKKTCLKHVYTIMEYYLMHEQICGCTWKGGVQS